MVGREGVGPDSALAVVLLAVVLVGVLDGLSQGAIFADAAALPPQYTHVSTGNWWAPAILQGAVEQPCVVCLPAKLLQAAALATLTW
jgi:hypothetical protein